MAKDMKKAILNFPKQFEYEPKIENAVGHLAKFDKFAFMGMGGSGLVGDLVRMINPELDIVVRKGYGLPGVKDLANRFLLFVSYSGNTEEILDAFDAALKAGHHLAVISTGGELLKRAKKVGVLYIQIPDTGIQPRVSVGLQLRAALKLMGREDTYKEVGKLAKRLDAKKLEEEGKELAQKLAGKVPIIYSSRQNLPLAYNWKIKFNETGKVPAFYNAFSELNHNEMTGFDVNENNRSLSENMVFVFLRDQGDHPRIKKRMTVAEKIFKKRGFQVHNVKLEGKDTAEKLFSSALSADWAAYYIALANGSEPNDVPMVEEFKKLIK